VGTMSLMDVCVRSETTISRHGCVRGRVRADQGADPRRGGRSRREAMGNGSCDSDSKATRSPEAGSSRTLPGAKSALTRPLANHWSVAVSPWHGTTLSMAGTSRREVSVTPSERCAICAKRICWSAVTRGTWGDGRPLRECDNTRDEMFPSAGLRCRGRRPGRRRGLEPRHGLSFTERRGR